MGRFRTPLSHWWDNTPCMHQLMVSKDSVQGSPAVREKHMVKVYERTTQLTPQQPESKARKEDVGTRTYPSGHTSDHLQPVPMPNS